MKKKDFSVNQAILASATTVFMGAIAIDKKFFSLSSEGFLSLFVESEFSPWGESKEVLHRIQSTQSINSFQVSQPSKLRIFKHSTGPTLKISRALIKGETEVDRVGNQISNLALLVKAS